MAAGMLCTLLTTLYECACKSVQKANLPFTIHWQGMICTDDASAAHILLNLLPPAATHMIESITMEYVVVAEAL